MIRGDPASPDAARTGNSKTTRATYEEQGTCANIGGFKQTRTYGADVRSNEWIFVDDRALDVFAHFVVVFVFDFHF